MHARDTAELHKVRYSVWRATLRLRMRIHVRTNLHQAAPRGGTYALHTQSAACQSSPPEVGALIPRPTPTNTHKQTPRLAAGGASHRPHHCAHAAALGRLCQRQGGGAARDAQGGWRGRQWRCGCVGLSSSVSMSMSMSVSAPRAGGACGSTRAGAQQRARTLMLVWQPAQVICSSPAITDHTLCPLGRPGPAGNLAVLTARHQPCVCAPLHNRARRQGSTWQCG